MEFPSKILSRPPAVELCVDSAAGAELARQARADRIEIATALECGGLTPSIGLVESAMASFRGPVVVLLRPRPGDFVYDASEVATMRKDIDAFLRLGVYGLALGALTARGAIDVDVVENLMDHSRPLAITFHRAFDWASDLEAALDALLALRVDRILTSGRAENALAGAAVVRRCVERTRNVSTILAGGGIDGENVAAIVRATGVSEVHGSAGRWNAGRASTSSVAFRSAAPSEAAYRVTDLERARKFVREARAIAVGADRNPP